MSEPVRADLQRFTGYLMRRAYVRAAGFARACLPDDSHVREMAVLSILSERGAVSQRELADITHVNQTIIVKLIDTLESKGWVARERNPLDRRMYALRLTAAGEAARAELTLDLDRGDAELTKGLSASELDALRGHLTTLLEGDHALDAATLVQHVGYLIAQTHRRLRGWAEDAMAPLGVQPRHFGALSVLADDAPCSQNHLASRLGISPPAVLAFVEELEGMGLVARERKLGDRRSYDLTLTDVGRQRLADARKVAAGVQDDVRDRLGAEGDEELKALLNKLIESTP